MERKGDHQKLKLLYLGKIFCHETDDTHGLTIHEIITQLHYYGVNADRKTLYLDIEELRTFGMDILSERDGKQVRYFLGKRDFELPELKLLVDAVQSSRFITDRKSEELIWKLEKLVSRYEGRYLHRQVYISGRIKSMNKSIYYNVDMLHEAIHTQCQIRFHYFQWNIHKEMELRRQGAWYQTSPWAMMWAEDNYYLVAYDSDTDRVRHFRVDKMMDIDILNVPREGKPRMEKFDIVQYAKRQFRMYSGEETTVDLKCRNEIAGVIIDRFGIDIPIIPVDTDWFHTRVPVLLSRQFLSWVFGLGDGVKILAPNHVVRMMKEELRQGITRYDAQNWN